MARPDARRGEAPRANPPSLARLLLGLARAGPSGSPEARPPLPSSYPSWGTRERNLGLLCDPPTRRCLEVPPVRSGHLCGLRGLWTPVAQGAFSFRNRKSKLTRTRTHRHKRTLTTRTCSDLCRTTATATETHPRSLILERTAVSWSNREVAVNKPRNTQKQEERNTHKRSCGDMECGPLRHRCPHPVLHRIPLRSLLLGLGYPGPLWPISLPTVLPLVDDVNTDIWTILRQAASHFAITLATVKWSSATSKALQTGEPWEAERQRPGAALQRSSCTEIPGLCRTSKLEKASDVIFGESIWAPEKILLGMAKRSACRGGWERETMKGCSVFCF